MKVRVHIIVRNGKMLQVLICGGDGTMGWILSCIDRMPLSPDAFPVAMMPLGTGEEPTKERGETFAT